ncbi:hypothetical protein NE237_006537 [Protea cynaroides]|uniref:Glutaredoxin domain-containing protein n=1 Tax=Protea cynaroides TaxID=273540 RepID=A0A9Q0QVE6_9MAGN|nr:hypothetical protein NE237_006537 [Protea cynaroides]
MNLEASRRFSCSGMESGRACERARAMAIVQTIMTQEEVIRRAEAPYGEFVAAKALGNAFAQVEVFDRLLPMVWTSPREGCLKLDVDAALTDDGAHSGAFIPSATVVDDGMTKTPLSTSSTWLVLQGNDTTREEMWSSALSQAAPPFKAPFVFQSSKVAIGLRLLPWASRPYTSQLAPSLYRDSVIGVRSKRFAAVRCFSAVTPELKSTLDKLVKSHKVVLFMKGTKDFPQCGFSNTVVQILKSLNVPFETLNILENEVLRQALKEYSSWPTFPQLYIDGEFFGGCDITVEAYKNGQLQELLEKAICS